MSPPSSQALQELDRLDTSLSDFDDKLRNILYEQEYALHEANFEKEDLVWFIDYLDEALRRPDLSTPTSRKCLRELRSICSTSVILPTSYTLQPQLLEIDSMPFTTGGFGDVYKGTFDNSAVCIKRIRVTIRDVQEKAKDFCKEAVTWKYLDHPNVLPLLGITIDPLQLVSKWVSGGNMREYITKYPSADRRRLLCDVARGLSYLHSRDVIHGDLKGPNILVEDTGHILIADFGLTRITTNPKSVRDPSLQNGLSLRWAAPEVWSKKEYSKKADIFSFGMVMIEIFTGAVPFSGQSSYMVVQSVSQGERPPRPTHSTFTEKLWELTQHCWDHDPQLRPEASEVLRDLLTTNIPAWKRLTDSRLSLDERPSLISSIFSDRGEVEAVVQLTADDAQAFIDVIDEVLDNLAAEVRRRCLHYLSSICGHQSLLPKSLSNPLRYDLTETVQYRGEIATLAKGRYEGQLVAVKILRGPEGDLDPTRRRFYERVVIWKTLRHPNILPLIGIATTEDQFTTVSVWMNNGNINEFIKAHPDANQLELLADVAKGLIYLHDQGIVHGNLNGSNVLIDGNNHACLAGFSLLAVAPDELIFVPDPPGNATQRMGSVQWSAPEVLEGKPAGNETDIFSFAMLAVEVFTGATPFNDLEPVMIISSILQGKRPPRPAHPSITGELWKSIQRCWSKDPRSRPEASEVLQILLDSNPPVWKRLISSTLPTHERINLITSIFSDRDKFGVFEYLSGNDAQAFVDVIEEASESLDNLPPAVRKSCLGSLYQICGREALLPKSLQISLRFDQSRVPLYTGGYADLWKGEYDGRAVAVKVLRIYSTSNIEETRKRFCREAMIWRVLRHPNVLPLLGVVMNESQFVMASEWMPDGNINEFVRAHPDANRLELLVGVTKGLMYLHDQNVVHGNLKGSNILIDNNSRASLANFGLAELTSDQLTPPTRGADGTVRWMGPELLDPGRFGLSSGSPPRESDCYALGMVIYEVLSRRPPFFQYPREVAVIVKVMNGGHPERPQGGRFPDNIWEMMKRCWGYRPSDRPSLDVVLRCLQDAAPQWTPPLDTETDGDEEEDSDWSA